MQGRLRYVLLVVSPQEEEMATIPSHYPVLQKKSRDEQPPHGPEAYEDQFASVVLLVEVRRGTMASRSGQPVEEEDASELKLGEDFVKAKCLMNAEVALVLQRKYEQLQQLADDPSSQISQVFERSLQYVRRFSRYQNPDAVKQVREVLTRNQLHEFEVCVIGNLCPETVEEAKALVPSITKRGRMDEEKIETMLTDLATIKKFE